MPRTGRNPRLAGAFVACALAFAVAQPACRTPEAESPAPRAQPNILLIVIDDLGYSDLGAYGSEIQTPNIDALTESGLLATEFYVAPRGAPTRAMLLTGVDNHIAGFGGRMDLPDGAEAPPGYEGELSGRVVTVASLLRDAGYHTYIAGKWELGASLSNRPAARGFERSFALHDSSSSHWSDMRSAVPGRKRALFTENGKEVDELPPDYYSTRYYTNFIRDSIDAHHGDDRPFFAYLSYQAVHGPLAVPEKWRERVKGRYDEGFNAIRQARLIRMKSRGLVEGGVLPYPGIPTVPDWTDLDDGVKEEQAQKMELYAAMLECLDAHVGELLDHLRELGEYDDTLIVVMSDNGPEPGDRGSTGNDRRGHDWFAKQFPLEDPADWGQPGAFVEYGPGWAQVSSVPFRMFKGTQAEGGIRSPLIIKGPGVDRRRLSRLRRTNAVIHVTDLTPTFLALAGVSHPTTARGRPVAPLQGASLLGLTGGRLIERRDQHDFIGMAYAEGRAARTGRWKITWMPPPFGIAKWRLYRIDRDPAELFDLSKEKPKRLDEIREQWEAYAKANGVIIPENGDTKSEAGTEAPEGVAAK